MNSKVYKWCAVPYCVNTSIKTPNKVFVYVPRDKSMRKKWLKLARRDPTAIAPNSPIYFCEDHFTLDNDMENYMEYHIMGSVSQVRMKPGCVPTKFDCQPDRKRRKCSTKKRASFLKKQRRILVEESIKDLEERTRITEKQNDLKEQCVTIKQFEFAESTSISAASCKRERDYRMTTGVRDVIGY